MIQTPPFIGTLFLPGEKHVRVHQKTYTKMCVGIFIVIDPRQKKSRRPLKRMNKQSAVYLCNGTPHTEEPLPIHRTAWIHLTGIM